MVYYMETYSLGEGLSHSDLTLGFGLRPAGLGVEACSKGRHMNERGHSSLLGKAGDSAWNLSMHLIKSIVDVGQTAISTSGRHQVLGLVVLADQIDDDIAATQRVDNGLLISWTERHQSELQHNK